MLTSWKLCSSLSYNNNRGSTIIMRHYKVINEIIELYIIIILLRSTIIEYSYLVLVIYMAWIQSTQQLSISTSTVHVTHCTVQY